MLVATFTSIAASIDGNVSTNESEENKTATDDLTDILESALSDPDEITLGELMAAGELIHSVIIQKLNDPVPWFICNLVESALSSVEGYTLPFFEYLCEETSNEQICDAVGLLEGVIEDVWAWYDENCGDPEGQTLLEVEGSTSIETSTCPHSEDSAQQLIQDNPKQELNK